MAADTPQAEPVSLNGLPYIKKKRTVLEHIFGNANFLYDSYPKMCCSSFACGGQTHCRQELASFDVGLTHIKNR